MLLASMLVGAGCSWANPGPAPLPPAGGAAPVGSPCERAQTRLTVLGCPEAATPAGTPFQTVCERAAADGRDFHPNCLATIRSCSEVEQAYRGELCQ